MQLIGLTGGTGSGKSAAGKRFAERGIPVIDADKVGHAVYEPGGPAYQPLVDAFGPAILTNDRIDRDKLGALAFNDETARKTLNAIVHPAIMEVIGERCANFAQAGHQRVIIDAALLGEGGQRDPWLDQLILVLAPTELRVTRLAELRQIDEAEARRRIAAQSPPENKLALADHVIENEGTLDELYKQVDAIVEKLSGKG